MAEPIISVANVSKAYRMWESPASRLTVPFMETLAKVGPGAAALKKRAAQRYRDFWALKDVSFEVGKGEAVGIIGRNGSGKSTLLQLIVGTLQPTLGTVRVNGRVAALLELGSGFNPDFTGRENVYLNATVLGLSRAEIQSRFAQIAEFADIGDFMEQPVKTYSSGMMLRLAFAVQTAVEPDILIIDEALGVGDFFFQQKCAARMRALRERGTTLLFVSHDMASVRDLCQRALYLRKGETVCFGPSQDAIARYYAEDNSPAAAAAAAAIAAPPASKSSLLNRERFRAQSLWWTESAATAGTKLLGVALFDAAGHPTTSAQMGQNLRVQVLFTAAQAGRYHVALELKNRFDQVITSVSSYTCGLEAQELAAGDAAVLELDLTLNFEAGRYTLQALLAADNTRPNQATRLDSSPWVGPLEIHWDYANERAPFLGQFGPPASARFLHEPAS